ncbi:MAG: dihydrofolate reductase [Geminicoccaceae bacterium]
MLEIEAFHDRRHGRRSGHRLGSAHALAYPGRSEILPYRDDGKALVMGRRTLESIGGPLPGRGEYRRDTGQTVEKAGSDGRQLYRRGADLARAEAGRSGVEEIMVIGGAEIYRQLIGLADRLHVTEIDLTPDGDACFPIAMPSAHGVEISRERHPAEDDQPAFDFVVLERC